MASDSCTASNVNDDDDIDVDEFAFKSSNPLASCTWLPRLTANGADSPRSRSFKGLFKESKILTKN